MRIFALAGFGMTMVVTIVAPIGLVSPTTFAAFGFLYLWEQNA